MLQYLYSLYNITQLSINLSFYYFKNDFTTCLSCSLPCPVLKRYQLVCALLTSLR
ncbi:hypothetical protein Alsa1_CDS0251 [Staphylococcus phage Alsa_1]|nr:hypothetical protein Alsa1_CDS0251 [Staphylococcus phage Alsa_1]WNM50919.1 hypothetical protein Alsa3_CDS0050 [Staphylococcus phage Alsa_3]WNM51171.1 hypothetical protein Alsa4_CDS0041 [Staphylococcus phage Alsa_4]